MDLWRSSAAVARMEGSPLKLAFTPVVYEHGARFVGRTPWEVSRDADLLFAAHRAAYLQYRQQVIAVAIDIITWMPKPTGPKCRPAKAMPSWAIHKPLLSSAAVGTRLGPFDPERDGTDASP
jgi:uroporphyrinogen decarboxylase